MKEETLTELLMMTLGREVVVKLAKNFGGCRVYIPMSTGTESDIQMIIGLKAMKELCRLLGGSQIDVPRLVSSRLEERNRKIIKDKIDGSSINQLCTKYQLSRSQIKNITRGYQNEVA